MITHPTQHTIHPNILRESAGGISVRIYYLRVSCNHANNKKKKKSVRFHPYEFE